MTSEDRHDPLSGCMDARVWAHEWAKTIAEHPHIPHDHETMIGWFANAIMAGYDEARRRYEVRPKEEVDVSEPTRGLPDCGHGHVYPSQIRARCGGPGICAECSRDQAAKIERQRAGE